VLWKRIREGRLKSRLPAQRRKAWAQILVEINEVGRFARPHRGGHANIGSAGPANSDGREVISLCRSGGLESNAKKWYEQSCMLCAA